MKIAVDCRKIRDGGIGTYLRNLLIQWRKKEPMADFCFFYLKKDYDVLNAFSDMAELIPHDYPKYSLSEMFSFTKPLRARKVDVFFTPHYTLPYNLPCASVATIHDLIHLKYRPKFGVVGKIYAKRMMEHACKKSKTILTDSENSKQDILQYFSFCTDKIKIVHPAVDKEIFKSYPHENISAFRKEKGLPNDFVLYAGALKSHKNPAVLIEIANQLNFPVILASNDNRIFIEKILPGLKNQSMMKIINIKSDVEMALIYNCAKILVFPSLYEGFGLPPLEAMACGLPVVCSNKASLPEVVGDAAVSANPEDHGDFLKNVNLLWRDEDIRNIFRARGKERIRLFDWGKSADLVYDILTGAS